MALNANALTLLATAKDHLDILVSDTSQNTRIERMINTASQFIARYCRRTLVTATHTEYIDGRGGNRIMLKEWPITGGPAAGGTKPAVYIDSDSVFGAGTEVDTGSYYVANGITLIRVGEGGMIWPKGYRNIKVIYTAGYGVAGTMPSDLEQACLDYVMWLFDMRNDRRIGRATKSKSGETVSFVNNLPEHIAEILEPYVKYELPVEAPVGILNQ
jgi:hypothetical protein